jgi:aminoglycoside 3-N-acetyltransferase
VERQVIMAKAISYRDLVVGLRELGLDAADTVIAHADMAAFGELRGGTETLVGALVATGSTILMPTFTYQTMIVPPEGPSNNGMEYSHQSERNADAEMFYPALPVHPSLGPTAEAFRSLPQAQRSSHPVLSFAAVGEQAEKMLATQSIQEPWGPVKWLHDHAGDVLLLGADHTANVALHLAEQMAGRKQFVRWAISDERAYRLDGFPGCSRGFNAIAPKLAWVAQQTTVGSGLIQRIPLRKMVDIAVQMIQADRTALLCDDTDCALCNAIRAA